MKKRILSVILAIAMLACMIPLGVITAFADGPVGISHTHKDSTGADVTFSAISDLTALKTLFAEGGSGYLNRDIDINAALTVGSGKTVNLCLNGYILTQKATGVRVFTVPADSTLNLYDCNTTEHFGHIDSSSHLWVADTTKGSNNLSVYGGYITGGNLVGVESDNEGGACVKVLGTFKMYSGNIVGCTITGESNLTSYGGAVQVEPSASFTMSGGTITGCCSAFGAVCTHNDYTKAKSVIDGGAFTMSGGTIDSCYGENGGAVNVFFGKFEMKKGTIKNCTATNAGGAIKNAGILRITGGTIENCTSLKGGAVFTKDQKNKTDAAFTMIGGTIQNCTSSDLGGGVYTSYGTATITGGTIQNCIAAKGGGGVYVDAYTTGLTVGGNMVISENFMGGNANNLHLATGKTIELTPIRLPSNINVGVTMDTPGRFTEPTSSAENANDLFKSDSANYLVKYNNGTGTVSTDDYLELIPVYAITNGAPITDVDTSHGYLTTDKTTALAGETVTVTVTPSDKYQLKANSLKVNGGDVTITDKGSHYEFTMPSGAVTVTAEFEKIPDESEPAAIASVLSDGSIWIIIAVAVVVLCGIAALVIVKKKKKPTTAGGENKDEE